ncbi:uncharacterized protein LOC127707967 isoform X1 [Mytilus californianus]|uniref:uncharacterized protein LOC127707967 isoform X1 n=1 Tax=Mytilus californianus TaxID=6549 RepID=UPI002248680E|nr:uncharacterized protein LOC127707967 isoform X1 [Mytilus californianus]
MVYRPGNTNVIIIIYWTFYLFVISAGQPKIPCTFPCDFINKTFDVYSQATEFSVSSYGSWTFSADKSTGTYLNINVDCFQISEQFLVLRLSESSTTEETEFLCFPVFYTVGQSFFKYLSKGVVSKLSNISSALTESQLCKICDLSGFTTLAVASVPESVTPVVCEVPSFCQPSNNIPCPGGGSLPTGCSGMTTNPTTTTTTNTPTTTTSDTQTTIRTKKPCGRRRRKHINGH